MKRTATIVIAALALLGILATGLIATGCGGVSSAAVATVGGARITKAQFQELMTQVKTQVENQGKTFPAAGSATYKSYKAMIVAYLVQTEIVAQSASKFGVSVSDKQVADQVALLEKKYGGEKKLLPILKQQGVTMALLKQSIKRQLLNQLVAAKVVAKASVSGAQIKAYWQAHAVKLRKSKKTATFAKAKATIRKTLLSQAKSKLWSAWLTKRTAGVKYAANYDPAELTASPTPSSSGSASSGD